MVEQRQFDVWTVRDGGSVDLVVILQANALAGTATVVVAPLVPSGAAPELSRATPLVQLDGAPYLVAVHLLMTIHRRHLVRRAGSLTSAEWALKGAVDMVFFGI